MCFGNRDPRFNGCRKGIETQRWCADREGVKRIMVSYFYNLFVSNGITHMEDVLGVVEPCISKMDNAFFFF